MSHVDEGTLHAYLDGELPGAEMSRFTAHLAECAECRARLEEERALVQRARDLLALVAPPSSRARKRAHPWRRLRLPLAWAATVALAFAIGRYEESARPGREVKSDRVELPIVAPPVVATRPAAPHPGPRASIPSSDTAAQREVAATPTAVMAQEAVAPPPPPPPAPAVDLDSVRHFLAQAPVLLPGAPVRRVTRAPDGIVVEQQLESGEIIRLYERQALAVQPPAAAKAAPQPSARRTAALDAAAAGAPPGGERLARYVGSLRVEITGPLSADSLSKLLDLVK